jgi:GGDEF domain-containing protein
MVQLHSKFENANIAAEPQIDTAPREELLAQLPQNLQRGFNFVGQQFYGSVIGPHLALYQGLMSGIQQGTQEFQLTMRAIEFHWKYELGSADVDTNLDKFESFYRYARQNKFEHLLRSTQIGSDTPDSNNIIGTTLANVNRNIGDLVGQIGAGIVRAPVDTASALSGLKLMIDYARHRGAGLGQVDSLPGNSQVVGSVGQGVLDVLLLGAGGLILKHGDDSVRAVEAIFRQNPSTKAAFAEAFTEVTGQSLVTFASMTGQDPDQIVKAIAVDSLATLGLNGLNRYIDSRTPKRKTSVGQSPSNSGTSKGQTSSTGSLPGNSSRAEISTDTSRAQVVRRSNGQQAILRNDNSYTPPGQLITTGSGEPAIESNLNGQTVLSYADTTSSILKNDGTHTNRGRLLEDPSGQYKVEYTRVYEGTSYTLQEYRDGNFSLVTPRGPTPSGRQYQDQGSLVIGSHTDNGQFILSLKDGSSKIALSRGAYSHRGQLLKDPAGFYKVQYEKEGVTLQQLPTGEVAMQKQNGSFTLPGTEKVLNGQRIIEAQSIFTVGQEQHEVRFAQFRDGRVAARAGNVEGTYSAPLTEGSPFVWPDGRVGVVSKSATLISLSNESGYRVRLPDGGYSATPISGRPMRLNRDDVVVTELGQTDVPVAYGNNGTMYVGNRSEGTVQFDASNPIGLRELPPRYVDLPDGTIAVPLRDGNYAIVDQARNARVRISESEFNSRLEPKASPEESVAGSRLTPRGWSTQESLLEINSSTANWLESAGLPSQDARKAAELATPWPTKYGRPSGVQNFLLTDQLIGRVKEGMSKAAVVAIETPANVKALNSFFHSASEADEVLKAAASYDGKLVAALEDLGYTATVRGERGAGGFLSVERSDGGQLNQKEIADVVSRWQVATTQAVYDRFPGIDQLRRARSGDDGAIFGAPVTVSDVIEVTPDSSANRILDSATKSRDTNMEQMELALASKQGLPPPSGVANLSVARQGRPSDASALDFLDSERDIAVSYLYNEPQQFLPLPLASEKREFLDVMTGNGFSQDVAQDRFNRLTGVINSQSGYISQSYGSFVWDNIQKAAESGKNAVVLGTDVANMGGCNSQIGAENVDKLMFGFSNRFIVALKQGCPEVEIAVVRNGGDEVYFAMVFPDNFSQKQIDALVETARNEADALIKRLNLMEVVLPSGEKSTLGQAPNPRTTSEKPAPPGHSVYWSDLLWVEPGGNVVGDIDASVEFQKSIATDRYRQKLEEESRV